MKKKLTSAILVLILFSSSIAYVGVATYYKKDINIENIATASSDEIDWWPMYHHDLKNIGFSESNAPSTNKVLWTVGSWNNPWFFNPHRSSPAVADDKLYIGGCNTLVTLPQTLQNNIINQKKTDPWLYPIYDNNRHNQIPSRDFWSEVFAQCIDVLSGEELWRTMLPGEYYSMGSPSVEEGFVYITATESWNIRNGHLYCLDAETGSIIWSFNLNMYWYISQVVSEDRIYVAGSEIDSNNSFNCILYCLDALSGLEIYNVSIGKGEPVNTPALENGRIYLSVFNEDDLETYIYCINATDGSIIWDKNLLGQLFGSSPVIYDESVIITSVLWDGETNVSGILWNLNAETGNENWHYITEETCNSVSTPSVAYGNIYMTSFALMTDETEGHGAIVCLDASTGDLQWKQPLVSWLEASPAVADGKVYLCSANYFPPYHGDVYCLDAMTGETIWQYFLPYMGTQSSPAIANESLYIVADDIYSFDDSAPANTPPTPSITGTKIGEPDIVYDYTVMVNDSESSEVYIILEFSDILEGWIEGILPTGEPIPFSKAWGEGHHFIRLRAKDENNEWSDWEILEIDILNIEVKPTYLFGSFQGIVIDDIYSIISTKIMFSLQFNPLWIRILLPGEKIIISNDYIGFIGSQFLFGRFNADIPRLHEL
jgi:outer membrane protein assembly factor BamB